jgi:hypothetical protein
MSQGPTGFELCLPGTLVGLILAAVVLAMGETLFPDVFQQVLSHHTVEVLPIAVGAASGVGLTSVFFHYRGDEEKPPQHVPSNDSTNKNGLPSGGTDAH